MKLIAILPVRNEAWVLGLSLRSLMRWVDEIVVLNHCSTDATAVILDEIKLGFPGRLTVLGEPDPVWHEMAHRQRLLEAARERGATHIALVDADEVLTGNLLPHIRNMIASTQPGNWCQIPMHCLWRGISQYRSDSSSPWSRMWTSTWFADSPNLYWKARGVDAYDFHHRHPMGMNGEAVKIPAVGGLMHLQFVDWRRLTAKHALYKVTEASRWPGMDKATIDSRYNLALNEVGLKTTACPGEWWEPYTDILHHLQHSEPWQEDETRRIVGLFGRSAFAGLNLFGVA